MPETSIPLGGIHLKLLRLSLETRSLEEPVLLEKLDFLERLSLKAESLLVKIACSNDISGGYSDGVPPLPIPNREVKPDRADGTAHPRESRSPPFYESPEFIMNSGLSFCIYHLTGLSQFQHLVPLSRLFLLHILAFSRISITFASSNSRGASK